jgi:hypothetical protein
MESQPISVNNSAGHSRRLAAWIAASVLVLSTIAVLMIWALAGMGDTPPGASRDYSAGDRFSALAAILLVSPPAGALTALISRRTRHLAPWKVVIWLFVTYLIAVTILVWIVFSLLYVVGRRG